MNNPANERSRLNADRLLIPGPRTDEERKTEERERQEAENRNRELEFRKREIKIEEDQLAANKKIATIMFRTALISAFATLISAIAAGAAWRSATAAQAATEISQRACLSAGNPRHAPDLPTIISIPINNSGHIASKRLVVSAGLSAKDSDAAGKNRPITVTSNQQIPPGENAAILTIDLGENVSALARLLDGQYSPTLLGTARYDTGFAKEDSFQFCYEFHTQTKAWQSWDLPTISIQLQDPQ